MQLTFSDIIMTHVAEKIDREGFYPGKILECILDGKDLPDPNNSENEQPNIGEWRRIDTPVPDLSQDAKIFRGMHGDYAYMQREEVDPEGIRHITIIAYPRKEMGEKAILEYTFLVQDPPSMDPSDRIVLPDHLQDQYYLGSLEVIRVEKSGIFKRQSTQMIVGVPNPGGKVRITFSVNMRNRLFRYRGQQYNLSPEMAPYIYQSDQIKGAHEYTQEHLDGFRKYLGSKSLLNSLRSHKK